MRTAKAADKETYSGRLVDLLCPMPEDIDLGDVATSLAFQNRFDGHNGVHYSVAQHSIFVASLLEGEDRIHGLLHDAPEFLIGDLTSPVKTALKICCPAFPQAWSYLERAAERAVYEQLGIELPTKEARERVKRADIIALATEQRDIMKSPNHWSLPFAASNAQIIPYSATTARLLFLHALARCGVTVAEGVAECFRCVA